MVTVARGFLTGDAEAPWRSTDPSCEEVYRQPEVLVHRLALVSGRLELALEIEAKLREKAASMSFSDAEYDGKRKQTRREIFLGEMEQVVPWKSLLGLIEPLYPVAGGGRRPYPLETMLRVHLMQNWFGAE